MPLQRKETTDMSDGKEPSGAQKAFGEFAPAFVHFTDDVLFGEVWPRTDLSPKERSLVTVTVLATLDPPKNSSTTSAWPRTTATPKPNSKRQSLTSPSTPDGPAPCPRWLRPSSSSAANPEPIQRSEGHQL